jgi:hypothetical protein
VTSSVTPQTPHARRIIAGGIVRIAAPCHLQATVRLVSASRSRQQGCSTSGVLLSSSGAGGLADRRAACSLVSTISSVRTAGLVHAASTGCLMTRRNRTRLEAGAADKPDRSPQRRLQSRTVWSRLPVARVCPSGLNATA